jgi:hypothetical protein
MIIKERYEPGELRIMEQLEPRMIFTEKEKQRHYSLKKGYEGEVQYDIWMKSLEIEHLTLNDLLLESNGTTFQLDSSVLLQDKILVFEIKNNEGDYFYDGERLKMINGDEIKDPLLQLSRSTSLLRQLLASIDLHLEIESYVLFINPEFTLYHAPKNAPIILPSQLNRFMKKTNKRQSKVNTLHRKIAAKLLEMHIVDNPYKRVPKYEYEQLKKGVVCGVCHRVMDQIVKRDLVCSHCGSHEKIDNAVLRTVGEIKLLFPERKVTTALIHEWCNGVVPLKTVRRILNTYLESSGERHTRYFL